MGLLITNSITTSVGSSMSNTWATVTFHTQELLVTGKVQCDISFYKSEADHDAGTDKIYPVVSGSKVTNCTITLALSDEVKASGQSTMADVVAFFYGKIKSYLETTYSWTVTVE